MKDELWFIRFERTFPFGLEILWEFFASLRVRELHQEQVTTRDWNSFSLFAPEGRRNLVRRGEWSLSGTLGSGISIV